MEKPKKLGLYVDGILAKYQNNLLINTTINKLDNDQNIEEFITNEELFTWDKKLEWYNKHFKGKLLVTYEGSDLSLKAKEIIDENR